MAFGARIAGRCEARTPGARRETRAAPPRDSCAALGDADAVARAGPAGGDAHGRLGLGLESGTSKTVARLDQGRPSCCSCAGLRRLDAMSVARGMPPRGWRVESESPEPAEALAWQSGLLRATSAAAHASRPFRHLLTPPCRK